jgi:hypothetical protein
MTGILLTRQVADFIFIILTSTDRVARFFKSKIPVWVNFGGSCNGRCWYILLPFGLFYVYIFGICCGHLVYFKVIWYILQLFGICYGNLVYFTVIWYILRVIWYILRLFGIFYSYLVCFRVIWYILDFGTKV